jgi:hypothetical protein
MRALTGEGLNHNEGRTKILDWLLDRLHKTIGLILLTGIELPEIWNVISVPMGSVTYNEIKITKYLEWKNSTILTENLSGFIAI